MQSSPVTSPPLPSRFHKPPEPKPSPFRHVRKVWTVAALVVVVTAGSIWELFSKPFVAVWVGYQWFSTEHNLGFFGMLTIACLFAMSFAWMVGAWGWIMAFYGIGFLSLILPLSRKDW